MDIFHIQIGYNSLMPQENEFALAHELDDIPTLRREHFDESKLLKWLHEGNSDIYGIKRKILNNLRFIPQVEFVAKLTTIQEELALPPPMPS